MVLDVLSERLYLWDVCKAVVNATSVKSKCQPVSLVLLVSGLYYVHSPTWIFDLICIFTVFFFVHSEELI
jgi:hypothetical protein